MVLLRTSLAFIAFLLTSLTLTSAQAPPLIAPTEALSPALQQSKFILPEGFEIQLVLSEPDIGQPMNLNFDCCSAGDKASVGAIKGGAWAKTRVSDVSKKEIKANDVRNNTINLPGSILDRQKSTAEMCQLARITTRAHHTDEGCLPRPR